MQKHEFVSLISDVFSYFQRTPPKERALELWYAKVQNVPSEAVDDIRQQMTEMESVPHNVPGCIFSCYHVYLQRNPDRRSDNQAFFACRNTNCDMGILMLQKEVPELGMTEFSANCGDCRQRNNEPNIPMITMRSARELGYGPFHPNGSPPTRGTTFTEVVRDWPSIARSVSKEQFDEAPF